MADIFREVDEELRRDKAAEWWKRYSIYIYAVALLVIVGTAGYQGWRAYDEKLRGEQSDSYAEALQALSGGDKQKAVAELKALSDPSGTGYRLLAALTLAQVYAQDGDMAAADQIWQRLSDNGSVGQGLRQLGSLYIAMQQVDKGDPTALRPKLEALAVAGEPYRFTALELLAALALRQGDTAAAREHLTQITDDPTAPSGSRSRAAELLDSLPG